MQKSTGMRLKEERERLKLSQEAFGNIGGVKKLAQHKYEKDERAPDSNYLAALSLAGVDILYVLTGRRSPPPGEVFAESEEEKKLLENYRAIDSAARLNIQAVGDAFAKSQSALKVCKKIG
ncbi:Putative prophage transcriptional regulator [Sodalis praecaptivus]|uniref:Putative prophage transcriptional regulator n=1 Tax=Sodalis praecaptivus TaxID=1239307 RepID=W0HZJ6_9GAMM|nr:helix-turn-helix transcriptional regulator [Sodalis praecaptivus]AHF77588.1 Putative prophage transcriptional regulator [Sodalis praecaptivus]